jgi:hypothetical protein
VVLLVVASSAAMRARGAAATPPVPFSDLLGHLDRGEVAELVVAGDTLDFKLSSGKRFEPWRRSTT